MAPSAILAPQEEQQRDNYPNLTSTLTMPSSNIPYTTTETLDLISIGFGPASLAIAIAHHDAYPPNPPSTPSHKNLFLEKQPRFAWHAGMQLPGAKMQISFLKDLATPRDPRSKFTFTNYLFEKGRLNQFINLGTFLPTRVEYEDYMRWCAAHFEREGMVSYGVDVKSVSPASYDTAGKVTSWEVTASDSAGTLITRKARHVVIAVGGKPVIPTCLQGIRNIRHSSEFATSIKGIEEREKDLGRRPSFVVVGSGQSAAEIFNDLSTRFGESEVRLLVRGASLRPSDDSPFVNEIFDPDRVDSIYSATPSTRAAQITLDRGTNYGVVRLSLLEHLYEQQYMQRIREPDEKKWRCRIMNQRVVKSAEGRKDGGVRLRVGRVGDEDMAEGEEEEVLEANYVFTATGYLRNTHESLLSPSRQFLRSSLCETGTYAVGRDYRVRFDGEKVDGRECGVWLQGCNEETHGLSDTLLSILAIRGGELVDSIFGPSSPAGTGTPQTISTSTSSSPLTSSPLTSSTSPSVSSTPSLEESLEGSLEGSLESSLVLGDGK